MYHECIFTAGLLHGPPKTIVCMPQITEKQIAELVDTFYGKVRADQLIGPIFAAAVGEDWDPHLVKMRAFWATVMLASRTYKGNPMMAHLNLPRLTQEHFERWLDLWRQTTSEVCGERAASKFVEKAEMIAERFLQTISLYHDASLASAYAHGASQAV